MGLDIYFEKRKRNDERYEKFIDVATRLNALFHLPHDEFVAHQSEVDSLSEQRDELNPRYEVAYFRKVNFLMSFFNYEGNCEYIEIAKCQVEDLIDACDAVLATKKMENGNVSINEQIADKVLPTQCGFCFGDTEYDEWYISDVESVREKFAYLLDSIDWDSEILEMYCWW